GREVVWAKRIDCLEDPGVHTLRGVSRQRPFRQYIGFEADEGECHCYRRVAPQAGDCRAIRTDAPGVRFVNVHPHVQRFNCPHGHERRGQQACRSIFAKPNIHLENRAVDWCLGYRFIEIGSRSLESGYCLIELCLRVFALRQEDVMLLLRARQRCLGRRDTCVRLFGICCGGLKALASRPGILHEMGVACEVQRRSVAFSLGAFEIGACLFDGIILQDAAGLGSAAEMAMVGERHQVAQMPYGGQMHYSRMLRWSSDVCIRFRQFPRIDGFLGIRLAVNVAETSARRGEIALTRLRYAEAATHFANAAAVFPTNSAHEDKRINYLEREASALYQQGNELGDNGALLSAIERRKRLVELLPRGRVPLDWATTQNNLGLALVTLG